MSDSNNIGCGDILKIVFLVIMGIVFAFNLINSCSPVATTLAWHWKMLCGLGLAVLCGFVLRPPWDSNTPIHGVIFFLIIFLSGIALFFWGIVQAIF